MSTERVFVRTAAPGDLQAIRDLLVETWHATYDAIYGIDRVSEITDDWHSITALQRRLGAPESEFVVADDGERLLGMAFAHAHGDHVHLDQLYVLPSAQHAGVGTLLLDEIVVCFDEAGELLAEVEAANLGAIAFYRRRGFAEVGRHETCNGRPGFDTLLMRRAL